MHKVFDLFSLAICVTVIGCTGGNTSQSNKDTSPSATNNDTSKTAAAGDATHIITGDLTLHGTTKSITFPAKVTTTDDTLTLNSTFTIDRAEYGMTKMTDKVHKEVTVKVSVKVARKGDGAGAITPENSKIEFVGSASDHKHDGGFKAFTGSIKPPDADITKSTISVEIEINSIWTDDDDKKKMLTPHLKSNDFFDAKVHPKASFVSKEIKAEK
jgi:polyisoprenoid-binding protein YceI